MRIAIVGGSFDPPTMSHLVMGEVVSHLVDRVVYVPAGHSPLKTVHFASPADRLAMIRLAVRGNRKFVVSESEVFGPEPSYMIETLRRFRTETVEPVLVIGSDCYRQFHRWHCFAELLGEFEILVVSRPGYDARNRKLADLPKRGVEFLSGCGTGLSSTAVRARLAAGLGCRHMLPDRVLAHIRSRRLYALGDDSSGDVGGDPSSARFLLLRP